MATGFLTSQAGVTDADGRALVAVRLGSPVGAQQVVGRATEAISNDVLVRFTLNAAVPPRNHGPGYGHDHDQDDDGHGHERGDEDN
jgi:hypothetical protein